MNILAIFVGGGFGAVLRYLISLIFQNTKYFITGTLTSNILASFILGFLFSYFEAKTNISIRHKLLLTTGFCGGLSTFSTFALESFKLYHSNGLKSVCIYSIISVLLCILAIFIGIKFCSKILSFI